VVFEILLMLFFTKLVANSTQRSIVRMGWQSFYKTENMVEIQRIETITDFAPKRVKRYLFIWCSSGHISIEVDNKLMVLGKNQVLTITSGQYHCFQNTNSGKGYVLDFTLDFICKTEKDIELVFQNSLFCHFDY